MPANRRCLNHQSSDRTPDRGHSRKKREAKEDLSAWQGPRPRTAALASTAGKDCRSTGQPAKGENEETVARADKEETG
jgi:hypothetical protein